MRSIRIPLHSRKYSDLYAIVDENDAELVNQYRWHPVRAVRDTFYAQAYSPNHKSAIKMHRLIIDAAPGQIVDHINRDKLDNRRSNLRMVTNRENTFNVSGRPHSSSIFKGVSRRGPSWQAQIHVLSKHLCLGAFRSEELAAEVYDIAARHYFGDTAYLNFDGAMPGPEAVAAWEQFQLPAKASSPYRGVYRDRCKSAPRWRAAVSVNGVCHYLGVFSDEVAAAVAYDRKVLELRGPDAEINFPDVIPEIDDVT